ncbi:MAG: hypothetical protein M3Y25_05200, partial [Thermoproteota archaeon]|nr:hypothetical protein [Thermoproteota archaeon]
MSFEDDTEKTALHEFNKTLKSNFHHIKGSHLGKEFYNRVKLFPWWLHYHKGDTVESELRNNIIRIGRELDIDEKWMKDILRHTVSEFSKKGLG